MPPPGSAPVPAGYVAYYQGMGTVRGLRRSAGLGTAAVVLFWVTTAAAGLLAYAFVGIGIVIRSLCFVIASE